MATDVTVKKVRLSVSNAVHSLAVLVAYDEGLFRAQGLDVALVRTAGSAHVDTDRQAVRDAIFERPLETMYNSGGMDQFRLCEWGIMKRAVDGELCGQRPARIVALGAAMSTFAIVTAPHSGIYEPEQLQNTPVAVTIYNGSHFTTLKMLEGFLRQDEINVINAGTMPARLEALFRAQAAAAALINANPARYAHYLTAETRGLLEPQELQAWRLLYAAPVPYTRKRFERTYQWMLSYPDLVTPGATYEAVVDNRAWE